MNSRLPKEIYIGPISAKIDFSLQDTYDTIKTKIKDSISKGLSSPNGFNIETKYLQPELIYFKNSSRKTPYMKFQYTQDGINWIVVGPQEYYRTLEFNIINYNTVPYYNLTNVCCWDYYTDQTAEKFRCSDTYDTNKDYYYYLSSWTTVTQDEYVKSTIQNTVMRKTIFKVNKKTTSNIPELSLERIYLDINQNIHNQYYKQEKITSQYVYYSSNLIKKIITNITPVDNFS